jgi:hypothetical protein
MSETVRSQRGFWLYRYPVEDINVPLYCELFSKYIVALGFLSCGCGQQIYSAHDFSQQFSLAFNRSRSFQDSFVFVSAKLMSLDIGLYITS